MKVARTVLRGERGSNAPDLLDHRGLLHHPHSGKLDCVGWRHVRLQPQRGKSRVGRRGCGWSDKREDCRETTQITNFNLSEHGI